MPSSISFCRNGFLLEQLAILEYEASVLWAWSGRIVWYLIHHGIMRLYGEIWKGFVAPDSLTPHAVRRRRLLPHRASGNALDQAVAAIALSAA
jgi:hypothetical protein